MAWWNGSMCTQAGYGLRTVMMAVGVGAGLLLSVSGAGAQVSDGVVRIGVLNDQSGPYAEFGGLGSVVAARMAVGETGGAILGFPVDVIAADHGNSRDKAVAIASHWFDSLGVDVVVDLTNSGVALGVQEVARVRGRIALFSGAATADLTGKACSPTGAHWAFDTYSQAVGVVRALMKEGKDSWFILAADYAFGHAMEAEIRRVVEANGGKVVGAVRHPLNAQDFSQELVAAQASGAKVVALASAGADTVNAIKQGSMLGITDGGQALVGLVLVLSDIHNIGLADAKGLSFLTAFYWDRDPLSRAFARAFEEHSGRKPGMVQASVYSSTLHYLKAVAATGTDDSSRVMAQMKAMPVNDAFTTNGILREDGRMVHDMYLAKVKAPRDSKGPWDYYTIVRTVAGVEAFRPLSETACPLLKK